MKSDELTFEKKRTIVLHEADWICVGCGADATEVDHKWPRKHGGTDELSNLQAMCRACNAKKGDALLFDHMTAGNLSTAAQEILLDGVAGTVAAWRYITASGAMAGGMDARAAWAQSQRPLDAEDCDEVVRLLERVVMSLYRPAAAA